MARFQPGGRNQKLISTATTCGLIAGFDIQDAISLLSQI
jgi:hypothetical protein